MRLVTLYTRPGCHLCEDAAELLEQLSERIPMRISQVNILDDIDLFERYKHTIPVIALAGGPVMQAPIRPEALERMLMGPEGGA